MERIKLNLNNHQYSNSHIPHCYSNWLMQTLVVHHTSETRGGGGGIYTMLQLHGFHFKHWSEKLLIPAPLLTCWLWHLKSLLCEHSLRHVTLYKRVTMLTSYVHSTYKPQRTIP